MNETPDASTAHSGAPAPVDPLFLATVSISTFEGAQALTNASGFFFERDQRLFLVTSRHVVIDEPSQHHPDRIEITLHLDAQDLTQCTGFSMLLYADGVAVWRQGADGGGEIDVATLEIDRTALPPEAIVHAFSPEHLLDDFDRVAPDAALCIAGFPLGFGDAVHQLPVLRHGGLASPFGIRFQGKGYFLTDARTHRGCSGAPVVMRMAQADAQNIGALPWVLLGVHSARLDMGNRDLQQDESLGLNCAWYADILLTLTQAPDDATHNATDDAAAGED
ncbi:MAG: trypsin-like peptidase domain-containing protein [Hydrogenophaga sp.]|uniref:trypsin-like peptidase domain-containing protein n=1 Tax=Hydrogenophaga sp. TaxID=1904254 RepID=UPI001DA7FCCE|nr:trypsin-like peptidase domain-containing protein [Hydrogenophaga sp.]MBX3610011.1 trypsin-like peptidase domain-containing protein [Hydrogenophaga sp.]